MAGESKYEKRIRALLAKETVTPADALEGIVCCFVAANREWVEKRMEGLGLKLPDEEVERYTKNLMRPLFEELNADIENPTPRVLRIVKEKVDEKMRFSRMPEELQRMHDEVCDTLVRRIPADG